MYNNIVDEIKTRGSSIALQIETVYRVRFRTIFRRPPARIMILYSYGESNVNIVNNKSVSAIYGTPMAPSFCLNTVVMGSRNNNLNIRNAAAVAPGRAIWRGLYYHWCLALPVSFRRVAFFVFFRFCLYARVARGLCPGYVTVYCYHIPYRYYRCGLLTMCC